MAMPAWTKLMFSSAKRNVARNEARRDMPSRAQMR
jgi:hypothetical protein